MSFMRGIVSKGTAGFYFWGWVNIRSAKELSLDLQ